MRPDGTLLGTHWGPASAIAAQPHRLHDQEVAAHTPTRPWGSRRLPRSLQAGDPRRTLFGELLRRSEGVAVSFPDGTAGRVAEVVFPVLGFDFWPEQLIVRTPEGQRRLPTRAVARIDPRAPGIEVAEGNGGFAR